MTTIYVKTSSGRVKVDRIEHTQPDRNRSPLIFVYAENNTAAHGPTLEQALNELSRALERESDDTQRILHEDSDKKVTIKP